MNAKFPLQRFAGLILPVMALSLCPAVSAPIEPTYKHVKYGPYDANILNVWIAPSDKPTPVLVKIHGGGWTGGELDEMLENDYYQKAGVTVIAIEYRLTGEAILPAPVHDAARAVQFIRSKAAEWNIDKSRLAVMGGSAGACTSLWLALHDDMANPKSEDPIARESTKPMCVGASNAQTSIDPPVIREWFGDVILKHPMIWKCVGAPDIETVLANYPKYEALYREFSPINFVDKNDPAIYFSYAQSLQVPPKNGSEAIHHPIFGARLKEKADAIGLECILQTKDIPDNTHGGIHKFLVTRLTQEKKSNE